MSFNKRILPNILVLEERLNSLGTTDFLKIYYYNPDAIIGSKESFEFVKNVLSEETKSKKTS